MGRCLTISHTCFPCLPSRQVSPCVLCPLWSNDGSANASFKSGEYGFISIGIWCYSREWVWNSRTKLCCIALGECDASKVSLQEFDIRCMFSVSNDECILVVYWLANQSSNAVVIVSQEGRV